MAGEHVKEFTDDNFDSEVLSSQIPVVVDLWAPWCGPCKMLGPIIDEIAPEYKDSVKIGKLNVDNNPQVSVKYGVNSIPTILFFKNGNVVDRQVGLLPKTEFKKKIATLLES